MASIAIQELVGMTPFSRGCDSNKLKVLVQMKRDPTRRWMIRELNGNPQTVRVYLKDLIKAGLVEELAGFPKMYRLRLFE
jgi:hypothetical protein